MGETPGREGAAGPPRIVVDRVSKRHCRDLRAGLAYGLRDAWNELTLRRPAQGDLRPGEFWALDELSFSLAAGESLGILGRNGAGKSTLLKLLMGRLRPSGGRIEIRGRVAALTELGLGFDPVLTGRENARIACAVLGWPRPKLDDLVEGIFDFSGVADFADTPVQSYSSGMKARLGLSVGLHTEPDIFLIDEVLGAGDFGFQNRAVRRTQQYIDSGGTLVLVSHSPHMIQALCGRSLVIEEGRLAYDGPSPDAIARYLSLVREARQVRQAVTGSRRSATGQSAPLTEAAESGSIAILNVAISGPIGGPPYTGESADLRISYRCVTDTVCWPSIVLLSADLSRTVALVAPREPLTVGAGDGDLICRLPSLALPPGAYGLRAFLSDPESMVPFTDYGMRDDAPRVRVMAASTRLNNAAASLEALLLLENWRVDQAPSIEARLA